MGKHRTMVGYTWWTKAISIVMARRQKRKKEDLEFPYTRLQQLQGLSLGAISGVLKDCRQ